MSWREDFKVGDKVRTSKGYVGVLAHIYIDRRCIVDLGNGVIYGCSLSTLKKEEEKDEDL